MLTDALLFKLLAGQIPQVSYRLQAMPSAEGIHAARKESKRARATLRLLRLALGRQSSSI